MPKRSKRGRPSAETGLEAELSEAEAARARAALAARAEEPPERQLDGPLTVPDGETPTLKAAIAHADRGGIGAPVLLSRTPRGRRLYSANSCCTRSGMWRYMGTVRPGSWVTACKAHIDEHLTRYQGQSYAVTEDDTLHPISIKEQVTNDD